MTWARGQTTPRWRIKAIVCFIVHESDIFFLQKNNAFKSEIVILMLYVYMHYCALLWVGSVYVSVNAFDVYF